MIMGRRRKKTIFGRRRGNITIVHKGRFIFFICLVVVLVLSFCVRTIYAVRRKVDEYNKNLETNVQSDIDSVDQKIVIEEDTKPYREETESGNIELPETEGESSDSAAEKELADKNNEAVENDQIEDVADIDHKEFFADAVFLGDSITEAISFYGFVDRSRIIADKGLTVSKAMDRVEDVATLKPSKVFILFGMNDILEIEKSEKFIDNYVKLISKIRTKLPDSQIYVQSILPVDLKVEREKPLLTNSRIEEFNKALQNMAEREDVKYLNINSAAKAYNGNLLEPDGIHYIHKFYDIWLSYIREHI